MTDHLVDLPGTEWTVWRRGLLRTAGFPADGLDLFAAPECAAVADDPAADPADFAAAFAVATERIGEQAELLAADPLLREAITWQNRSALHALDGLRRRSGRPTRRRERQEKLSRYWQRYCGKNETVGFFGPVCWVDVDPAAPPVTVTVGESLTRRRQVYFEYWALVAYVERLVTDAAVRPWLPVCRQPHLTVDGTVLHTATGAARQLSPIDAAVLSRCTGVSAAAVAADLAADPDVLLRKESDVHLVLDRLIGEGLVRRGIDLPQRLDAEDVLRAGVAAIVEPTARMIAVAGLSRLSAARDAVAAAAGDAVALRTALEALDAEFTEVTGALPDRRAGATYAGRGLCHEETTRDLDVTVGGAVLESLAAPLDILLRAARWLTVALADAYRTALVELHADLGGTEVPLGELWFLAQGMLFGTGERPVDGVAADFAQRFATLFGLADVVPGTRQLRLSAADLAPAAARVFAADGPGWSAARVHSPDLHICATDVAALRRGEFSVVLGEMHTAWATFDAAILVWGFSDPGELRDAMRADVGDGRVLPLYPDDWPRYSGRLSRAFDNDSDVLLAFGPAPGADDRTVAISALRVDRVGDDLVVRAPDGRTWPIIEAFAALIAMHAVDGFKLVAATGHSPRISIDQLVVARETWRTTIGATPLPTTTGPDRRYLAVRRWRAELGLPERAYVKIGTEIKPCYVDFTSPVYVSALCNMARGAHQRSGPDVPIVISEMLPTPDQAWVPDAAGRRYFSELRLQLRDPKTGGQR